MWQKSRSERVQEWTGKSWRKEHKKAHKENQVEQIEDFKEANDEMPKLDKERGEEKEEGGGGGGGEASKREWERKSKEIYRIICN